MIRARAPLREPLSGVPDVLGGETPPRYPQRLPVRFLVFSHGQTNRLTGAASLRSELQTDAYRRVQ